MARQTYSEYFKEFFFSFNKFFWYNFILSFYVFMFLILFDNEPTKSFQKLLAVLYSFSWIIQAYYILGYPLYTYVFEDNNNKKSLKEIVNEHTEKTKKQIKKRIEDFRDR